MKRHEVTPRRSLKISATPAKTGKDSGGGGSAAPPGSNASTPLREGRPRADEVGADPSSSQALLAAEAFEFNHEGMLVADSDLRILHANRAFSDITGYTPEEIAGKRPAFLNSGAHGQAFYQEMWAKLAEQGYWQGEIWDRRKNGSLFPAWLTISAVGDRGSVRHYVGSLSDITEKKRAEARAEYLSLHDALTGLPNKAVFLDRLAWSITAAHRRRQRLGVLALSLDLPQPMGSSDIGDIVLKQAASRLLTAVRESDAVARFDEDELVVLLDELSSIHHAEWVARKILCTLRQPFTAVDRETRMDASIGIALFPQHDADATGLVKKAERAMRQVRSSNKNTFQIFSNQIFNYIG